MFVSYNEDCWILLEAKMAVPQLDIADKLISALQNNKLHLDFEKACTLLRDKTQSSQTRLSAIIKQIALKHLANSNTPASKMFRGEHLVNSKKSHQEYLLQKAQNDSLGSEIEAKAIGEALQINIVVTSVYKDRSNTTWCLHLASEYAPTAHLYNSEEIYWANNESFNTPCLFTAISQELQELTRPTTYKTSLNSHSIFRYGSPEKETVRKQTQIVNAVNYAIKTQQSPIEKEIAYLQEEIRIQELPNFAKDQMKKDYEFALQLARKKMQITKDSENIFEGESRVGIKL